MRVVRVGLSHVKGMRHEARDRIELDADCVREDRVFALVDPVRKRVLRTVENPTLLALRASWYDGALRIVFPDGRVVVDRPTPAGPASGFEYWGRHPGLTPQRTTLDEPLSEYLGSRVELAKITRPGDVVYGAALTLVTTSDIAELGRRAREATLAEQTARFRATMVIDDADPQGRLAPDSMGVRLRIGSGPDRAEVEITGPIPRCAVIDRHPVTGVKDGELLRTLTSYRRHGDDMWFGHYARVVVPGICGPGVTVTRAP